MLFRSSLERLGMPSVPAKPSLDEYEIDPGVLAVLTEYEEHRLRTSIEQGVANPTARTLAVLARALDARLTLTSRQA